MVRVAREKASDLIIRSVKEKVASGELAPGARLPNERDFAAQYRVSQPTAREAVRGLEVLGLVTSRHGSGVFVASDVHTLVANNLGLLLQLKQMEILDVFDVRVVLGRESVRLAAGNRDVADLARIRQALDALDAATTDHEYALAGIDFLGSLSAASGNPLLATLEVFLLRISAQFQLAAYGGRAPGWWTDADLDLQGARRRLYETLRDGPVGRVEEVWWEYTSAVRERFATDPRLTGIRLADSAVANAMASQNV
ncbi:hypothetical protein GCM10009836_31830 [Pseudonocardia ailaonensis]|uniref:HTH gntR-type domain-containing protein n=1 Tax=Pseudonocardia ailaonensis TaxID=367279 RepID=A0ABN2N320_9PSEU